MSAGEPSHLFGDLQLGDAVADQRFVDVEVEEPHLGIGDALVAPGEDPDELEEGDEREAGGSTRVQWRRAWTSWGLSTRSRSSGVPRMTRMRSTSSGSSPVSLAPTPPSPAPQLGEEISVKPKARRPSCPARFRSAANGPLPHPRDHAGRDAAAAVQRPRLTGTIFPPARRFSVAGETPARREASLRDIRSSRGIGYPG